jgi:hypothetical protein
LRTAAADYPVARRQDGMGAAIIVLAALFGFLVMLLLAAVALAAPIS